jgi:hypothetical protein
MIESKVPSRLWSYFSIYQPKTRDGGRRQVVSKRLAREVNQWMAEQGLGKNHIRWSERPEPFIQFETESQAVLFRLTFGS